jgi:hypothetical protein
MGISIRLEDEHANVMEEIDWPSWLDDVLPPHEDETFQCLRFIDPYGDTVFNRVQMPTLLSELERLRDSVPSRNHQQFDELVRLAQRCLSDVHLYIRFYGD